MLDKSKIQKPHHPPISLHQKAQEKYLKIYTRLFNQKLTQTLRAHQWTLKDFVNKPSFVRWTMMTQIEKELEIPLRQLVQKIQQEVPTWLPKTRKKED